MNSGIDNVLPLLMISVFEVLRNNPIGKKYDFRLLL